MYTLRVTTRTQIFYLTFTSYLGAAFYQTRLSDANTIVTFA